MGALMEVRKITTQVVEIPDLHEKISQARIAIGGRKSLSALCREAKVSRTKWYDLESRADTSVTWEMLQRIQTALETDFGVKFDES